MTQRPKLLLLTGGFFHDFDLAARVLTRELGLRFDLVHARKEVDPVDNKLGGAPALAGLTRDDYDAVVICTQGGVLTDEQERGLIRFVESGGGLLVVHGGLASFKPNRGYHELVGADFDKHPPGVFDFYVRVDEHAERDAHPLAAGLGTYLIQDELYVSRPAADQDVFAWTPYLGEKMPMGYTRRQGEGRVCFLANGHDERALENRAWLFLLDRAARWVVDEDLAKSPYGLDEVRAGVVGYGLDHSPGMGIGRLHAKDLAAQAGARFLAACDIDDRALGLARQEHGADLFTTDRFDELLANDEINLVLIATPHDLHHPQVLAALRAGKHVVTDKPFALTPEHCDEMIAEAESRGLMLTCYQNHRWDAFFGPLLAAVRAGEIGEPAHIDSGYGWRFASANVWRHETARSGGLHFDTGCHFTDWILNLIPSPVAAVSAFAQKRLWHNVDIADIITIVLRFADGRTATHQQTKLATPQRDALRIQGTKGAAVVSDVFREHCSVQLQTAVGHAPVPRRAQAQLQFGPDRCSRYYTNVVNHLLRGDELIVQPWQARRVVAVLHAATLSAERDGAPVPINDHEGPLRYLDPV